MEMIVLALIAMLAIGIYAVSIFANSQLFSNLNDSSNSHGHVGGWYLRGIILCYHCPTSLSASRQTVAKQGATCRKHCGTS